MVLDIYNKTGDKIQFPRLVDKNVKGKALTTEQYQTYQTYVGQETQKVFDELAKNSGFRSRPPEEQSKQLQSYLTKISAEGKKRAGIN